MKSSFFTLTKERDTELTELSADCCKSSQYSTQQWCKYCSTVTLPHVVCVEKRIRCLWQHEQKALLTVYSSWGDIVIHSTSEGNRQKTWKFKTRASKNALSLTWTPNTIVTTKTVDIVFLPLLLQRMAAMLLLFWETVQLNHSEFYTLKKENELLTSDQEK